MNAREQIENYAMTSQREDQVLFLNIKAYRGVEYVDAHQSTPPQSGRENNLSYRGVPHTSTRLASSTAAKEPRNLIYRGQAHMH